MNKKEKFIEEHKFRIETEKDLFEYVIRITDLDNLPDDWIDVEEEPKERGFILINVGQSTLYGYWNGENFQAYDMSLKRFMNVLATKWQPLP